jgi:hypothetical protein
MRVRLIEFIPLLLVGVILLVFQLSRMGTPVFPFEALRPAAPPSTPAVARAVPSPTTRLSRPTAIASPSPAGAACTPARPLFASGMLTLKSALGAAMGEPQECEHPVDDQGDTQQKTSTGLAYYRQQLNVACFTTGWDHWALTTRGLVTWTGESVDPPPDAAPVNP